MLELVSIALMLLWATALAAAISLGGVIHILPILGVAVVVLRMVQGQRV